MGGGGGGRDRGPCGGVGVAGTEGRGVGGGGGDRGPWGGGWRGQRPVWGGVAG